MKPDPQILNDIASAEATQDQAELISEQRRMSEEVEKLTQTQREETEDVSPPSEEEMTQSLIEAEPEMSWEGEEEDVSLVGGIAPKGEPKSVDPSPRKMILTHPAMGYTRFKALVAEDDDEDPDTDFEATFTVMGYREAEP